MEAQNDMVLDSKHGVLHGIKRKRAALHAAYFPGASHVTVPQLSHVKRRRLDCKGKSLRSLLRCYENFMKTGIPKRIMFYENGQWSDFPQDHLASIRKYLDAKEPAIELEIDGQFFVLDLLHMFRLDKKTGFKQPIAWIDGENSCFFPEIFADEDGLYNCCEHDYESDQETMFCKSYTLPEIKLHLEIDINGGQQPKLKECSGESSPFEKQLQIAQKPASSRCAVEVEDSCKRNAEARPSKSVEDVQQKMTILENEFVDAELDKKMDPLTVEQMFLMGMILGPLGCLSLCCLLLSWIKLMVERWTELPNIMNYSGPSITTLKLPTEGFYQVMTGGDLFNSITFELVTSTRSLLRRRMQPTQLK